MGKRIMQKILTNITNTMNNLYDDERFSLVKDDNLIEMQYDGLLFLDAWDGSRGQLPELTLYRRALQPPWVTDLFLLLLKNELNFRVQR